MRCVNSIANLNKMQIDIKNVFSFNKWLFFILLTVMTIGVNYVMNTFILTDNLIFNSFAERITNDRIEKFIHQRNTVLLWGYFFVPLILLVKILYPAICISIGAIFFKIKINIIKAFKLCLLAESIFIIASAIKMFYFLTFSDSYSIDQIQNYYPLSLINILNTNLIPKYFIFPLQKINLFEVAYCLILSIGVSVLTQKPIRNSLFFILSSYGVGLVILIALVVFININVAPNV